MGFGAGFNQNRKLSLPAILLLCALASGAGGFGCKSARQAMSRYHRGAWGTSFQKTQTLDELALKVKSGPTSMHGLSNREYLFSLSSLIGAPLSLDLVKDWTPNNQYSGFDSIQWSNLDTKAVRDRLATLDVILDAAIGSSKVMTCTAVTAQDLTYEGCAKTILERIAERAFRRPLRAGEASSLKDAYLSGVDLAKTNMSQTGDIFKEGVRAGLASIFISPQFMTKVEPASAPATSSEADRALDAYELASRLSFLMTGAVPDDELWGLAKSGKLLDPAVLTQQADRLLKSSADRFVENFMGQWFEFRKLETAAAGTLENSMWMETKLTLAEILRQGLPVNRILNPGFTYLNQQLATHYGIAGAYPSGAGQFAKTLTDERGGILTQGSILTLTSTAAKTSPIRRGRWVQGRILCKSISPPGPELFEQIKKSQESIPADATVKQRTLQHHNAATICLTCHKYMDPIGLGLEGFDQLAKKRSFYDTAMLHPVETDSDLLGQPFQNFDGLNRLLIGMPETYRCVAEKVAVFSLGQVIDATSQEGADLIDYLSFKDGGKVPSFRDLILRMVQSRVFRRVQLQKGSL